MASSQKLAIETARTALAAYDKAVSELETLKTLGALPKGCGSCVFAERDTRPASYARHFKCGNCAEEYSDYGHSVKSWKFCPSCGCEIIRFDQPTPDKEGTRTVLVMSKETSTEEGQARDANAERTGAERFETGKGLADFMPITETAETSTRGRD